MTKIIGIDLGTTNSCVAVIEGGEARVIHNDLGSRTTPSAVAFKEDQILIGMLAKRQAVTNSGSTLLGVKRLIGRQFDSMEIVELNKTVPYLIVPADNGDAWIQMGGKEMSPPEVSSHILRHLKKLAEEYLGEPVSQAVVTVPAYFDDAQRQATKDAGKIAGLEVRAILNEPTAAALAYSVHRESKPTTLAVFDLGGGTFDISILRVENGVFEVLATAGDTFLGGDDFDHRLVEALIAEFKEQTGTDISSDQTVLQRLQSAAETAKQELSAVAKTEINLPFVGKGPKGPTHLLREVTREWFEALCKPLIERLEEPCKRALQDAKLSTSQIDQVLLVGGMTRMPAIQEKVTEIFGKQPSKGAHPDEIVAMGAATQGAIMSGELQNVMLLDVTTHSLGLAVKGDRFSTVIARNTTIPCRETKIFATTHHNQEMVMLAVYQGDDLSVRKNRLLGNFVLGDLPMGPAGAIQVQVSFMVDADGILSIDATETRSGKATSKKILSSSGLSTAEVDRLASRAAPSPAGSRPAAPPQSGGPRR